MWGEHGLDLFAHPVGEGVLAMDRPADHRAVVGGFDELCQRRDVGARAQLARCERRGEVVRDASTDGSRSAERLGVEVGLGEVELEHRDRVGHLLGRGLRVDGEHESLDDARERRGGRRAVQGAHPEIDAPLVGREQEVALGAEALDERRGRQAGLRGGSGERHAGGADALGKGEHGVEDRLVADGPRTRHQAGSGIPSVRTSRRASRSTAPQSGRVPSASTRS